MPGGDRTGPMGMGPKTGRGMGFCAGNSASGYSNAGRGRGFFGRGGGGRGWRHWFRATGLPGWMRFGWGAAGNAGNLPADAQRSLLQNQADMLQRELDAIRRELDALSAGDKSSSQ
ncbi:MAG: DUF5320 domain-containing protein [Candidatus Hydrogenedentes bacterium]|nr:DUF5320 domain-containing protein [Candidatus Hydrogenedentota bacterium]